MERVEELDIAERMSTTPGASPDVTLVVDLDDPAVAQRATGHSGLPLVRVKLLRGGKVQWAWLNVAAVGFELSDTHGVAFELSNSDARGMDHAKRVHLKVNPAKHGTEPQS